MVDIARRHELVTLPSLFGLPPRLDVGGRRISEVVAAYGDLAERDEAAAAAVTSVEDISVALKRVDVFAVPRMSAALDGVATLHWREVRDGVYRLTFPPRTIARTRSGERIRHFDARLRSALQRARQHGASDVRKAALAMLDVDLDSVGTQRVAIEVRVDALNGYEVWRVADGEEELLKTLQVPKEEVFGATEAWVKRAYADVATFVDSTAPRNAERPTPAQREALKRLGMPPNRVRAIRTRGDASRLLDRLRDPTPTNTTGGA